MQEYIQQIKDHLSQLPFYKTFLCLWNRKKLQDGVVPAWLTSLVNWATDN